MLYYQKNASHQRNISTLKNPERTMIVRAFYLGHSASDRTMFLKIFNHR